LKKSFILLTIFTLAVKISGFLREILMAYFFGASITTDTYVIATSIPFIFFTFISSAFLIGFIPTYIKIENTQSSHEADKFTSNLLNSTLVLSFILFIVTFTFPKFIISIFASGFSEEAINLTVKMLRIISATIFTQAIIICFKGYFHIKKMYLIPVLIQIPLNIFVIAGTIIGSKHGNLYLPLSFLFGSLSQTLIYIMILRKHKFKYSFAINLKDKNLSHMLVLVLPILIQVSINDINIIIDKTLASRFIIGSISYINYANQVNMAIIGIIIISMTTLIFPRLSELAVGKNILAIKKIINKTIDLSLVLLIPIIIIVFFYNKQIISLLFERGQFNSIDVYQTAQLFLVYSLSIIPISIKQTLNRVFYSLNDTKIPVINASIGILLNIFLNLLFFFFTNLGLIGLALATTISEVFTMSLLIVGLKKKIGEFNFHLFTKNTVKLIVSSVILFLINFIASTVYRESLSIFKFIVISSISIFFYGILLYSSNYYNIRNRSVK
jgi:putative peptidoglycan lipid II flippase